MGIGENFQNQVANVISQWGTIVTLQTLTPTENAYGYVTSNEVLTSGTVKAVPSNFFKNKLGRQAVGNLNEGEVRMLFSGGTAFTNLIGTANNNSWRAVMTMNNYTGTYIPRTEKPIPLAGVEVAIPVVFTLDKESGY